MGGLGIRLPVDETLWAWSPETSAGPSSPFEAGDAERVVSVRHRVSLLWWRLVTLDYRITAADEAT